MQGATATPRGLRKATATRLLILLGIVIVLVEGAHFYALRSIRENARSTLAKTMHGVTVADAQTVTSTLDAFDRMTGDIFLAATGPYLVLAILIPSLLVSLARLQHNLNATENALKMLLENHRAKNGALSRP